MTEEERWEALAKTNPLFGPAKLKLGTFCTNASGGGTMSSAEGSLRCDWNSAASLARLAEQMRFEAIVPIGRWKGFGGDTNFNGESLEAMTFAAGISAITRYPSVFATTHVPSMHPVLAAKQASTIDLISGGRFTLNIVTGWNRSEIELFGSPLMEHDERYVMAGEWISLMKRLWTSDGPVDFAGKYFRVHGADLRPHPVQPYPALMSAGSSPAGRRFAARHCDVTFAALTDREPSGIKARVDEFRGIARKEFGRDIRIWVNAYVFLGDTQAEAERRFDYVVNQKGDWAGADNLLAEMGINQQTWSPEHLQKFKTDFIAGWAGFKLLGTKERIVDDLRMLSDAGVEGVLFTWPAFEDDMARFQAEVYPLIVEEGLR
jgi:alkanesulfonate monooxygenase SsuD/methylene tetrahydromethanopterin reductase-like flavin-dependent oxidoreductase (luciferase family)